MVTALHKLPVQSVHRFSITVPLVADSAQLPGRECSIVFFVVVVDCCVQEFEFLKIILNGIFSNIYCKAFLILNHFLTRIDTTL